MATPLSRRQFLRGDYRNRHPVLRPPWSLAERDFLSRCTRCGECANACAAGVLRIAHDGLPQMDFEHGGCSFCGACVDACDAGALSRAARAESRPLPWNLKAQIAAECLSVQGIVCALCREQCEARAITLDRLPGVIPRPRVNVRACTGCGACVAPCPVRAVHVREFHSTFARGPGA
jgi:ferredoxin-type protein NapF